jgi:hypothetical protein
MALSLVMVALSLVMVALSLVMVALSLVKVLRSVSLGRSCFLLPLGVQLKA